MKNENYTAETTALIARDFDLDFKGQSFTDQELFDVLADHVAYMIEYRLDFLLSLMYRLDILEHKINMVLSPAYPEPANIGLAKLILERQKQRIYSKKTYKAKGSDDWMNWDFEEE